MSNADTPDLPELEPIDAAAATTMPGGAPSPDQPATPVQLRSGLPAPFYNPRADKTYYRFLFCGVLITVGSFMPFGPQLDLVGYKTLLGGLWLVIGLGMIWTWWGAIQNNRATGANLKWIALCFLPFLAQLMAIVNAFDAPAVKAAVAAGVTFPTWGELFGALGSLFGKSLEAAADRVKIAEFVHHFGPGKFFVFAGALLAEVFFVQGIFGGAKKLKQQKQEKMAAAAERRRR